MESESRARPILIVDDDVQLATEIGRVFAERWPLRLVHSLREATEALRTGLRFAAAILDVRLKDGSGTDLVEPLREAQPCLQILVVTAFSDRAIVNGAHRAGAQFLEKPFGRADLVAFARALAISEHATSAHLFRHLVREAARVSLSIREAEVLALAVEDLGDRLIAERLGTTRNTVRTQMKAISRKFGRTFSDVVWRLRVSMRQEAPLA